MNKSFSFTLHDGSCLSFSLPVHNGQLVINRFMPDFLAPEVDPSLASAFAGYEALIDPTEFEQDCRSMVSYMNDKRLQTNYDYSYLEVLGAVLESHIERYGRLFFTDLCTYIDEVTYLMYGFGFDELYLKERLYPLMAFIATRDLSDYVKEGSPYGVIQFTSTTTWRKLKEYCDA